MSLSFTYTSYVEVYPSLLFFITGCVCMCLDYSKPAWWKPMLSESKIVPIKTQFTVLPTVCMNILQYWILTFILDYNYIQIRETLSLNYTIYNFIFRLGILMSFVFIWTYFVHRGIHHPSIYSYVHKKHHEFQHPFGFESLYSHPLENFLMNYIPHIVGYFLFDINEAVIIAIYSYVITILTHCGHEWSWSHYIFSSDHDVHHEKFNYNYGFGMPWMDKLMGTHKPRQGSVSFY